VAVKSRGLLWFGRGGEEQPEETAYNFIVAKRTVVKQLSEREIRKRDINM